ncbi:MAG: protein translocase subunit SecF [Actinobacteria bacterium]|nr:protein translocase subunit SecF [Actinomycetota bacterium]
MSAVGRLYRGENNIDFRKLWRWGIRISLAVFVLSILSLGFRGLNLGIEFRGGVSWEVKAPGVTVDDARSALSAVGESQAKIQIVGSDTLRVQGSADAVDKQNDVKKVLADLARTQVAEVAVSTVGPSWGSEVTAAAVRALVVFFLGVLLFLTVTLEFKMAVSAIVAVIHDIVISVGVYSIFQFEVTPATVIAFLTILGFSIYDTVVVYDKVKENESRVGLSSRLTYTEMMNLSMNQVIMRSLNTSIVALIPVISLLVVGAGILGAVTLEEFAIALTVGLFVGAYSSIFVAAPVVTWLKEREPRNRQLRARLEGPRVAAEPATDISDADALDGSLAGGGTATATVTKPKSASDRRTSAAYGAGPTIAPRPRKKKRP